MKTSDPTGWQPIETAPKDGTEIIVFHHIGGVCAGFCPAPGWAWHCMDGHNTRWVKAAGEDVARQVPSLTSFNEPPTHWMHLPAPPQETSDENL